MEQRIKPVLWTVTLFLAGVYVLVGTPKLLGVESWLEKFSDWGYSRWFMRMIGGMEVAGGLLLLVPRYAFYGALLLGTVMVGASYTHVASREGWEIVRPFAFLLLVGIVAWLRYPAGAGGKSSATVAPDPSSST